MHPNLADRFRLGRASWAVPALVLFFAGGAFARAPQDERSIEPLTRRISELGERLRSELDVERNVATAKDRWNVDGDSLDRMRDLMRRYADRRAIQDGSDRDAKRMRDLESKAIDSFGEEKGRELGAWLHAKEARVHAIAREMEGLGSEIGRLAESLGKQGAERAAAALERSESMRTLAESARRDAEENARKALQWAQVDPAHRSVDRFLPREALDGAAREAIERARSVEWKALERAQGALGDPRALDRLPEQLEMARRALDEAMSARDAARETTRQRALDLSADGMRRLADEVRRSATRSASPEDLADRDAVRQAAGLREERRMRLREELEQRRAELDRVRQSMEQVRQQLEELERSASRPKRSRSI